MTGPQLELEERREHLRAQRWKRHKCMIETAAKSGAAVVVAVGMLTGQLPIAALLRWIGA